MNRLNKHPVFQLLSRFEFYTDAKGGSVQAFKSGNRGQLECTSRQFQSPGGRMSPGHVSKFLLKNSKIDNNPTISETREKINTD